MIALKLCILSSEIVPYAKTGGLADVAGALIQNLNSLGHDVRAFMPLYAAVGRAHPTLRPVPAVESVPLRIGTTDYRFSLKAASYPGTDRPIYFVDCPALFDREALYTNDPDEHRRFLLLTRAAMESCQILRFVPDVFHCNDWHTAFLPLYLQTSAAAYPLLAGSRSVLTIHNIGYQGVLPTAAAADFGVGEIVSRLDQADLAAGIINALKTGIRFADRVTTVSPTYAREICETPLGMGMQAALSARREAVLGILNGVDYREWDPRLDPYLKDHFGPGEWGGKLANKQQLIAASELNIDATRPLVGMVGRLAEQKGIDLLIDALPRLLQQRDFGFVALGSGDARYVAFFEELARRFPGRAAFHSRFDEPTAHLIEAGSDIFLMPSRYEPCGLNQMYSLRYGTIPVVRRTGGLADSVQHYDPRSGTGTGCVFDDFDVPAVQWAMNTVLDWFANPQSWRRLMLNAMAQDFSWGRQALLYEALYRDVSGLR
jgi:starch synthase